jgi:hypothetical protein
LKHKDETPLWLGHKPRVCLLGDFGGVVIEDHGEIAVEKEGSHEDHDRIPCSQEPPGQAFCQTESSFASSPAWWSLSAFRVRNGRRKFFGEYADQPAKTFVVVVVRSEV